MRLKSLISLALVLVLVLGLVACNTQGSSSAPTVSASTPASTPGGDATGGGGNPNASRERVTIRVAQYGVIMDNARPEDDRIKKAIEDYLNIDLEYVTYEGDTWDQSLDQNLMAGMGFDIFHNWAVQEQTSRWVSGDVVVPIGELVAKDPERYPVLNKLFNAPDYQMFSDSITGSDTIYGVLALSFSRWYAGTLTYNRKIMEEAGFTEAPKTLAEFIEYGQNAAAAGYTAWWPRNATLTNLEEMDKIVAYPMGTTIRPNSGGVTVGMVQTAENVWKSMTTSEESREALRVLNEMYENGTLPRGIGTEDDFGPMLDQWDNDKVGALSYFVSSGAQYAWTLNDRYKKVHPEATFEDLVVGPMIQAEDGSYPKQYDVPFWLGAYTMISSACENPERALDYLEFLGSTQGQDLVFKGIEGVHYTMEGDKVVFNTEEWKNENVMYGFEDGRCFYAWGGITYNTMNQWTPWETSTASWFDIFNESVNYANEWTGQGVAPEVAYGDEITGENRANVFVDLPSYYALAAFSEDILAKRVQLKEVTDEYLPAFITGQKSLDTDWEEYVQAYAGAGAAEVEAAVNQAIADAKALYDAAAA